MLSRIAAQASMLAVLVLLAACAELGRAPAVKEFELELQGRIALRYGSEGGNARITWRHSAAAEDMLITSALGQGIARITREGAEIKLLTADGKEYRAADAEALTESVLGWPLPLAGLPDWVLGRPAQGRPAQLLRDDTGRVSAIEQDAWRIDYLAWREALPARINLRHDGIDGKGAIEIRLVIDELKSRL
jgi:outer membrane lipoprotein LolB